MNLYSRRVRRMRMMAEEGGRRGERQKGRKKQAGKSVGMDKRSRIEETERGKKVQEKGGDGEEGKKEKEAEVPAKGCLGSASAFIFPSLLVLSCNKFQN